MTAPEELDRIKKYSGLLNLESQVPPTLILTATPVSNADFVVYRSKGYNFACVEPGNLTVNTYTFCQSLRTHLESVPSPNTTLSARA